MMAWARPLGYSVNALDPVQSVKAVGPIWWKAQLVEGLFGLDLSLVGQL